MSRFAVTSRGTLGGYEVICLRCAVAFYPVDWGGVREVKEQHPPYCMSGQAPAPGRAISSG